MCHHCESPDLSFMIYMYIQVHSIISIMISEGIVTDQDKDQVANNETLLIRWKPFRVVAWKLSLKTHHMLCRFFALLQYLKMTDNVRTANFITHQLRIYSRAHNLIKFVKPFNCPCFAKLSNYNVFGGPTGLLIINNCIDNLSHCKNVQLLEDWTVLGCR